MVWNIDILRYYYQSDARLRAVRWNVLLGGSMEYPVSSIGGKWGNIGI
jgi:hypothetical protein